MDAAQKEYIRRNLPEEAPEGLVEWTRRELGSDLGGEYCVFRSIRVPEGPLLEELMDGGMPRRRKVWAAGCLCTDCHEEFVTAKVPGARGILLYEGEDGWNYTLDPGEQASEYGDVQRRSPGDHFLCPICGNEVELVHASSIRGGRIKRVKVVTVQNVMGYTGLFYWLVCRKLDEDGTSDYWAEPEEAYILTEHGGLVRYAHRVRNGYFDSFSTLMEWKVMSSNEDTIDRLYEDWGSANNRKQGAAIYEVWPELGGTTGEKTGVTEYLEAGGYRPVVYLKLWRKYRGLENLCKQGQARLVAQIINASWRFAYQFESEADPYIDLKRKKPHEMLRLTKGEFRQVRKMGLELNIGTLREWKEYCFRICGSFQKYLEDVERFGGHLSRMIELAKRWGDGDTDKVCRFLEKQGLRPGEVGLLVDTREIAARLYGDRVLTREELWPRRLQEAHDRYARMLAEREDREKSSKLAEGFQRVIDWYGCLEWTDGELSVILPRSNHELVQEGDVLRHCVGGYGKNHAAGTSLIFFIRRYRRPERSYYTLNISMKGRPREIQLHGYGNERHGPNKEYSHKIPAKVRAFCDRWENEVLLPWYHRRQEEQKKEKSA